MLTKVCFIYFALSTYPMCTRVDDSELSQILLDCNTKPATECEVTAKPTDPNVYVIEVK